MLTAVAYFMVTLDTLVVVTALPSIHRSFGGGIATLQWTVSAYTIAFGAGILTAAALGDRLGRRRVYVVGLALFTAASAACALAPDANLLIAFRAIQGIGAAIVMPLSLTILTSAFPIEKRGAVVGIWGGIAGVAVAAGPLIGGGITQGLNWHWIFWVNVPIGVAATVGAALRLPESYGPRARLDVPRSFWSRVASRSSSGASSRAVRTAGVPRRTWSGCSWERRCSRASCGGRVGPSSR